MTGELVRKFEQRDTRGHVSGLTVLDNGNFVCLHEDKRLRVWNTEGAIVHTFAEERSFNAGFEAIAKLADGLIVTGTNDSLVDVWDCVNFQHVHGPFDLKSGNIRQFLLMPTGNVAVSVERDSEGHKIVNPRTGEILHTLPLQLSESCYPEHLFLGFIPGGTLQNFHLSLVAQVDLTVYCCCFDIESGANGYFVCLNDKVASVYDIMSAEKVLTVKGKRKNPGVPSLVLLENKVFTTCKMGLDSQPGVWQAEAVAAPAAVAGQ